MKEKFVTRAIRRIEAAGEDYAGLATFEQVAKELGWTVGMVHAAIRDWFPEKGQLPAGPFLLARGEERMCADPEGSAFRFRGEEYFLLGLIP
jgi:predicted trehalose synthase